MSYFKKLVSLALYGFLDNIAISFSVKTFLDIKLPQYRLFLLIIQKSTL